jgi:peptidyl-prolyl cis-trans isomerase D
MLQQIRDKITGWFAAVFLGAIAIVFIFWGIQFESSTTQAAAKVNGEKIPVEAVRRAWQDRQRELQQELRDELPPEVARTEQQRLVDNFIRRELLLQRADQLGYRVGDRELAEAIAAIPAMQVDGKFDRDRYAALLRQQGRTEAGFEDEFRDDLQVRQLQDALTASGFALPGELRRRVEIGNEARDVQMVLVPLEGYLAGASVTEEQVAQRYEERKADFLSPEKANLQFLELNLGSIAAGVEVTEPKLREFYDQVAVERYTTTERRRARHILVESGKDDAAALAKAGKLADEARAGADFAVLATKNSDDPGSKGQGGDLGWATRESFVGPFADALFAMQPGEIKGPVKTQFGYHVIKLEGIEPGAQRSFEDVRAELESDYRRDQAQALFYERSQQLADESFAALTELESVAEKLGLELRTVEGYTRQGGGPFGADKKLIDAVFSDDVLKQGQNSQAVSIGEETVVVARVTDHQPPQQRPLADVRGEVEASLRAEAAGKAAEAAATAAAAKVAAGASVADAAKELKLQPLPATTVTRRMEGLPPELAKALFTVPAPAPGKVSTGTAKLANGSAVAFAVTAARPGTMPTDDQAQVADALKQLGGGIGQAEFAAYLGEIERTATITKNAQLFETAQ